MFCYYLLIYINIPVAPLSKSAFTVIPSYVSTFSTLMSSHISLSILNILLTSFCSFLSLAVPFGAFVYSLPCCAFPYIGHTTSPQFHHSLFLFTLHSGHKIFLLFYSGTFLTIASLLSHFTYSTLIISPFFTFPSL